MQTIVRITIVLVLFSVYNSSFADHKETSWQDNACGRGKLKYQVEIRSGCGNNTKCQKTVQSCNDITLNCSNGCGLFGKEKASINVTYGPGGLSVSEYRKGRGFTGSCGASPTAPEASFSRCNLDMNIVLDSMQKTISLVFDSALFSISNLISQPRQDVSISGDSSYYVFDISLFIPQSSSDTFPTVSNTFWSGRIVLFNGCAKFTGDLSPAGFAVTVEPDSVFIKASNLAKVIQFHGSNSEFEKIRIYTSGEASYGDPLNCIPAEVPTLTELGMITSALVLLTLGVVYIVRRRQMMKLELLLLIIALTPSMFARQVSQTFCLTNVVGTINPVTYTDHDGTFTTSAISISQNPNTRSTIHFDSSTGFIESSLVLEVSFNNGKPGEANSNMFGTLFIDESGSLLVPDNPFCADIQPNTGCALLNINSGILIGAGPFNGTRVEGKNPTWFDDGIVTWHFSPPESPPYIYVDLPSASFINGNDIVVHGEVTSFRVPCSDVPTLTQWGVIILAFLIIGTAVWVLRKRRAEIANPAAS